MAEENSGKSVDENSELFSTLGLTIGSSFSIETPSPVRKYTVQLFGYVENKSILISPPSREGKEILLDKNSVIAVRMLVGTKVCAFESRILYRSLQPYSYYHISYPPTVESLQVRNSERVDTALEIVVDSDFDIVGEWPKPAYLNNISNTGARINSTDSLGVTGHELILKFEINVNDLDMGVCLHCIIRNVVHNEGLDIEDANRYVLGVEFIGLTDELRLKLSSYIYENNQV